MGVSEDGAAFGDPRDMRPSLLRLDRHPFRILL